MLIGFIFGLLVLFQFTKNIDPLIAYIIMGLLLFVIVIMTVLMVQDAPDVKLNSFGSNKKKKKFIEKSSS